MESVRTTTAGACRGERVELIRGGGGANSARTTNGRPWETHLASEWKRAPSRDRKPHEARDKTLSNETKVASASPARGHRKRAAQVADTRRLTCHAPVSGWRVQSRAVRKWRPRSRARTGRQGRIFRLHLSVRQLLEQGGVRRASSVEELRAHNRTGREAGRRRVTLDARHASAPWGGWCENVAIATTRACE